MYLTRGEVQGDELSLILKFAGCPYLEAIYPEKQLLLLLTSEGELQASGKILDINGAQVLQEFQIERTDFDMEKIEDIEKTCEDEIPEDPSGASGASP
jgi:hypothetical protein